VGVVLGIVMIAFGAILTWAVTGSVSGLNVTAVGVILLVLGIVLVLLDILWWQSWGGGPWARTTYVEGGPQPYYRRAWPRRRVVVDEPAGPPGPPGPPPP
jgi:uncharacterized protein DUF6458